MFSTYPGDLSRMNSQRILRKIAPALALGFLMAFGSSVGQTYFISLFAGEIRTEFNLSHGRFGALYTAATIASAAVFLWFGKSTDHFDLSLLGAITLAGLSGCVMLMASINSVVMLCLILFGLRLFGQSLLSHVAITAMGRWFSAERGRALSIASLGYPVGEALLPILVSFLLTLLSWREIWVGTSVSMLVIILPTLLWLGHLVRVRGLDRSQNDMSEAEVPRRQSWNRAQVLRDPRFYALVPGLIASPFIITGVLFHQVHLVETKSWSLAAFAACYPLYAISATAVALGAGWMVDRVGTVFLLQVYLLPLAFGLVLLANTNAIYAAPVFMILMGATAGGATVVLGALWADLYGTEHLGAIRSLSVALVVVSTAIAPGVMGILIDLGVGLDSQFAVLSIYVFACAISFAMMSPRLLSERPPRARV